MNIKLRPIRKEDCDLLFKWVNDDTVRKNSFNSELVTYIDHKTWFQKRLDNKNTKIYICIDEDREIGQIRLEIENNVGMIDYSVAREYRGKGYGIKILSIIKEKVKEDEIPVDILIGQVKQNNIASQKAFINNGFIAVNKGNYIEYSWKLIR